MSVLFVCWFSASIFLYVPGLIDKLVQYLQPGVNIKCDNIRYRSSFKQIALFKGDGKFSKIRFNKYVKITSENHFGSRNLDSTPRVLFTLSKYIFAPNIYNLYCIYEYVTPPATCTHTHAQVSKHARTLKHDIQCSPQMVTVSPIHFIQLRYLTSFKPIQAKV